jgi:hypothetical protein
MDFTASATVRLMMVSGFFFTNFTFFQISSYRNLLTPTLRTSFFSTHLFYISSVVVTALVTVRLLFYFHEFLFLPSKDARVLLVNFY